MRFNGPDGVKVTVTALQRQSQVSPGQEANGTPDKKSDNVPMVDEKVQVQNQDMGLKVEIRTKEPPNESPKTPAKTAPKATPKPTVTNNNYGTNVDGDGNATGERSAVSKGDGNVVTGDKSVGGSADGDGTVYNWGNDAEIAPPQAKPEPEPNPPAPQPEPQPEPEPKPTISSEDKMAGKILAKRLHAETDSMWANNGQVVSAFSGVNDRNAYTFFKEYQKLADSDSNRKTTGAMHDSYDINDTFNNINIKVTSPAIQSLLNQAAAIGLGDSEEYSDLSIAMDLADEKNTTLKGAIRTPDLSNTEAKSMDAAISALLAKMDEVY